MELLKVDHLYKDFGGVHATKDISFAVEEGEHLAIIGPNGAGKTTLFNLLNGQLAPTKGRIYFSGREITKMRVNQRAHLGIARSFQVTSLFPKLTVLENIMLAYQGIRLSRFQLFRSASSYDSLYQKAEVTLKSMDLWEKRHEMISSISYGEQRKLEIALSLASDPKLLLLDEPSCGLTASESADITVRIRKLGANITVILVAHDMDLVFGVADKIMVLHYGEFIIQGTCEEIRNNAKVKEIYMGNIKC